MTREALIYYPYSYTAPNRDIRPNGISVAEIRRKIAPFRFALAASEIASELDLNKQSKVLELGCGIGLLGDAIKEKVGSDLIYMGLDIVFDSAKQSERRGITALQADATHLPFPTGYFDNIVSTDVLEHIPDAQAAVDEIKRVIKPGAKGFLVIADPSEGRFSYTHDHINRNGNPSNVGFWTELLTKEGLNILPDSEKYRRRDWRKIFNLPILAQLKNKPGFACAFNPVNRPGVYIVQK